MNDLLNILSVSVAYSSYAKYFKWPSLSFLNRRLLKYFLNFIEHYDLVIEVDLVTSF